MSFPNSPGGTLTLPSPTHGHKLDVPSAVRNLRRSLSRSPSKLSLRASFSTDSSSLASPQSPCRRNRSTPQQQQHQFLLPDHSYSAPPVAEPRPSVRLSLRALKASRTASPSRPLARARASPKSPLRRALNSTPDSGNVAQQPFTFFSGTRPSTGQENRRGLPGSPATPAVLSKPSRHSLHIDVSGASDNAWLKSLETKDESNAASTTGALKRSDATMNLDQPNQGSPVAKRRSLHGISSLVAGSTPEALSIFGDQSTTPQGFEIHEDGGTEYELTSMDDKAAWRDPLPSPTPSFLPRRTSSLRKSTLQQRYGDKGSSGFGRRNGEKQLAQIGGHELSTPVKNRPRLSNDQFCPPPAPRESIFSSSIPLPSASLHMMDGKNSHQPHPLSKTLTTSSSGNSLTEETYQYAPAPPPERPRAHQVNPFSRSLPINATRPTAGPAHDPTKAGAATPYNQSQQWPGAFHSTGLISKVNRNVDDDDKKLAPPDTPCKKHNQSWAATFPPPLGSAIKKKKKSNNRNSFGGLPSTPFGPAPGEASDAFGNTKGLHLFQRASAARSARRGSFLFNSLDEPSLSQGESNAGSNPSDIPPTPTKNSVTPSLSNLSNISDQSLDSPSANRTAMPPTSAVRPPISRQQTCKYTTTPLGVAVGATKLAEDGTSRPPASNCPGPSASARSLASFSRGRAQRGLRSPAPLGTSVPAPGYLNPLKSSFTKTYGDDSASPISGRRTPQTPRESLLPLDSNRFSMSQASADGSFTETNMPPPVTPTTVRDFKSSTSVLVTPVNGRTTNLDIDSSLYSRFDKVEQVGKGEFSTVYRVVKNDALYDSFDINSTTPRGTPRSPSKGQVFAVKKSRQPFQGNRDREIKLREAQILRALSNAEHVVHYVDDWEYQLHLYIQTEYCEEGNLEKFLSNIGFGGRLDDFRIFKILQDLCLVSGE